MKRILMIAVTVFVLAACNNNPGESGAVDDGMKAVDTNGALNDSGGPLTDSTNNAVENKTRVDIQQRDTSTRQGQ
ncbi:MAG: membrane lipoprotein lipid attachment site-containing protein [Bacteroidota bacterium]|nr:membrane lipoprotein lipid attachment site-containing protein [Flavisolibacter sp.]MBD0351365.1 membrane lipoprotein lipid attachment site-containing protein [Flavisolibacter sp.]MBD0376746.1 membrane lipoprotein lipid attachment site-containing protein [Flavisolibacter sp.]MDQ3844084.1 membrane lipoprotein lipid attachment site-containing protein [Bacteroidota bacterium]